ncbi:MAG: MerR family transcriptional regulator [Massilia sp.]|nr:chaperone modulator CbpM [Aquabacterium sp.]MBC7701162.1 MerR family transcriptional regulator [Aquabacterium sp.]
MNSSSHLTVVTGVIVEEEIRFTLEDLSRASGADHAQLIVLVDEGVLEPGGSGPHDWLFSGASLRRARTALRISHDLQLGVEGTALVLDLLDEIEHLRSRLRQLGQNL